MDAIIPLILTKAADAFIGSLISDKTKEFLVKLKADPVKVAHKQALGKALQRYAVGDRLDLARPLMTNKSILATPEIAMEIGQIVRFEREPNFELIGQRWRDQLNDPPAWRNFTVEAKVLISYFEAELKETDVFKPVFELKQLEKINTNTLSAAETLYEIEKIVGSLSSLIDSRFSELAWAVANASADVRNKSRDFTSFIAEKTTDFVGRAFVFHEIEQFIANNTRGYFLLIGDPGIGKSAISAQLVKDHGYIHHFNIAAEGINKASDFLQNVCAQLIAKYKLDHVILPPEASQDAEFLGRLLNEVSQLLTPDEKCVIVVDALDEASDRNPKTGANILFLPRTLPKGIFIIASSRRLPDLQLRVDIPEQTRREITQDEVGNIADIRQFVQARLTAPGIQAYIKTQGIDAELFVDHIVEKSQGNFIYLRLVLPEIERGAYIDLELAKIPVGLQNYYEDHWRRIKSSSDLDWFEYKLPIIISLTVVKEPVSIDLLSDFSSIRTRSKIRTVLNEFDPFIYKSDVEFEGASQRRFRWYHASFFDFIAAKEDIVEERVNLKDGHKRVADKLWSNLFND